MGHRYELPIFSFACAILVLLPLPWHWKARNVATLSLITWLFVGNVVRGINSIIWMNNVDIHYRVWCDIATKVLVGVSVALPACSLALTRHLEHVASARSVLATAADKQRRRIVDLCFTLGLPVLIMALHYIVQGHRFDIVEDIGCQPVIYTSIPGILIVFAPPLFLSICSLVYAALALRHFAVRRLAFEQHLRNSKSSLTTGRYMRLMALALSEMFWGTSLGSFVLFENVKANGLRPWISWDDVHYNFSRIAVFPNFLVPNMWEVLLTWWIIPSTAMLFFLFFGFSDEAREGYVAVGRWVWCIVLRRQPSASEKTSSLPQYRGDLPVRRKHMSLDDMSVDLTPSTTATGFLPPRYTVTTASPHENDSDSISKFSLTLPSWHGELSPTTDSSYLHFDDDEEPRMSGETAGRESPLPSHSAHHINIHVSTIRETH